MIYRKTPLSGVFLIEPELIHDERGFFTRTFCAQEFREHGMDGRFVQCNVSGNRLRGTLRGLHFQKAPYAERKLVRCTRGSMFDVAVDVRPESPTFGEWFGAELSEENHELLFIPEGVAHGFQTLSDGTEVSYQISQYYHPEAVAGIRWDDPAIGVPWPLPEPILSARDRGLPLLSAAQWR